MDEALKLHPLHDYQQGFKSDRNTDTALSSAANYIEKHIYNGEHELGVFLDIQAAFDTINPIAVKNALVKHGGDVVMVNWYYKCVTHRNIFITINGEKLCLSTGIGFPQGGVCSAKFWVTAYDDAVVNRGGLTV